MASVVISHGLSLHSLRLAKVSHMTYTEVKRMQTIGEQAFVQWRLTMDITITEIMDDLRAADEVTRRFERKYWLSSADFYELYQTGLLDDGENLEGYTLWAGFYQVKQEREAALAELSRQRLAQLRPADQKNGVRIRPLEPVLRNVLL